MQATARNTGLSSVLLSAIAPVIWGTTYLTATEYLPEGRPVITAVIRTLPAGLALIVLTRSFRPQIAWTRLFLLSLLNIGIFQSLLFVAAHRLPGGLAAIAGALQPLIVLALAWGVDRNQPPLTAIATSLAGIAGMVLLFASPQGNLDALGIAAAILGTASMATGTFLARRWARGTPMLGFTGWQLGLGGLMLLPVAWVTEPPLPALSTTNLLAFIYLSLIGTLLAYALWFRGITRLSPVSISALGLLSPVTALILGWMILDESLGARQASGLIIVLLSVVALQFSPTTSRPVPHEFSIINPNQKK